MDLTDRMAVWAAWRSLSQSDEWKRVVHPYMVAARDSIYLDLASGGCTPDEALRLLGRLSAFQEMIDLPAAMLEEADQQERMTIARLEQEKVTNERRRERPFARWRAGLHRR